MSAADGRETPAERSARVGEALGAFDSIRVEHARQDEILAAIDETLAAARATEGPKRGLRLIAPIGAGKTTGLLRAVAEIEARGEHPPGTTPVLVAEMDPSGTTGSVPSSIIRAMGLSRPDVGKESIRWDRAIDELGRRGVRVLAFDEFNRAARRPSMSGAIGDTIRQRLMDGGLAAVIFCGTGEAKTVFRSCPALPPRLDAPVRMDPLEWDIAEDRELVTTFLGSFDEALVDRKLLRARSGLAEAETARLLTEAAGGNIRAYVMILRTALAAVLRRRGARIERLDLSDAVEDWAIANGHVDHNPFIRP